MHAVGDRGDRHLVVVEARPQAVEHLAADDAVQLRDAVGALGEAQAHDGHVEHAGRAALVGLGAELQQPLDGHALEGLGAAEVELDERGVEAVDAGGHRGVRGEDGGGAHGLERLVEGHRLGAHELADPLDAEEAGVALVGVVDVGGRGAGDARPQPQRAHAAHAEQHLLLQAQLAAAAVEALGDAARRLVVLVHVGVEQQQRHPADLGAPDVGVQLAAAGQLDGDAGRGAVLLAQQRQRQPVGVEHRVVLLLPAVAVQALAEVAGLVEQADADDRHAEVGGRLEVVAGEDAQAAGVLRQRRGDAELGAEVGDRRRARPRPARGPTAGTSGPRRGSGRGPPWRRRPARRRPGRRPAARARRARRPTASRPGPGRRRPSGPGRSDRRGRAAAGASVHLRFSPGRRGRRCGRAGRGGR